LVKIYICKTENIKPLVVDLFAEEGLKVNAGPFVIH